uniref:C-type lectin domain-containing protein n=1 Tax=Kryptolebias marmoratus TaxID=37003 RepID=A0A3Q3BP78_KRYMA
MPPQSFTYLFTCHAHLHLSAIIIVHLFPLTSSSSVLLYLVNSPTTLSLILLFCNGLFSGPNVTFVIISTLMNWTEAQRYCREHHTDLASVRNEAENLKVKELITGINWIGLYRDTWKWVDGSSSSFRYWGSLEPDNYNYMDYCAVIYFQDSGRWEDWNCDDKKAFICQNSKYKKS